MHTGTLQINLHEGLVDSDFLRGNLTELMSEWLGESKEK